MSNMLMEERISRLKVKHNGRLTTISMDQLLMDYLSKKLGSEEKAKLWVRQTVLDIPSSPSSRPSLSRQAQVATIVFLIDQDAYHSMMSDFRAMPTVHQEDSTSSPQADQVNQVQEEQEDSEDHQADHGPSLSQPLPPSFINPW